MRRSDGILAVVSARTARGARGAKGLGVGRRIHKRSTAPANGHHAGFGRPRRGRASTGAKTEQFSTGG